MSWPLCIPVTWSFVGYYWLAYHHGWTDPRLYNLVRIPQGKGFAPELGGSVATVDDFGNLVIVRRTCHDIN